jgi:DNA primase
MKDKPKANLEFSRRRQKRLRENNSALKWLHERGLNDETISYFGLGLAELYEDREGVYHENALLAPVPNENGDFIKQTIYINIPDVTTNPANTTT